MVEFSHVTKTYKKRKSAVNDFSLKVDVPIFGFLGQNGAGKTTIMKMTVGLLAPTSGSILVDGIPSTDTVSKKKMGFMPETPYFHERMTGMEFLTFADELFEKTSDKKAHYEKLLTSVGLRDARNFEIRTYSKGMRQRLAFAQALVNDPQYVFLDEPLDGLDPLGRREMKEVMLGLKKEGKKIFLNTHILYDVEEMCDEVGIIHAGNLLYAGTVKGFAHGTSLEEAFTNMLMEHEGKKAANHHGREHAVSHA
ncbi:MAG TPA: ABC transporter ATP-binding protein [Candidatus Paceibacterota bacterium]|nr:ABC transporter ATP-binding protein [Candidatus Paceibacterota bacterium]